MRRADREITDFAEKIAILERCEVIRLELNDQTYPYVVPLCFGYEVIDDQVKLYIHGAKAGLKHDLIAKNLHVCVEADLFHRYEGVDDSVTARYEGLIGFGTIEEVTDCESVGRGLKLLLAHCGYPDLDAGACSASGMTKVYCITLESLHGKRNV